MVQSSLHILCSFCDIDDPVPDYALLEQMAQLEDEFLKGDDVDESNPLATSRSNDDELLLQMEELM